MNLYDALLGKQLGGGGGGGSATLITKSITENGSYSASADNADGYSAVSVDVANTYTASDEGKVVSDGALVAQGSDTVTQNGTVDTTLISSLLVNVQGGTGGLSQIAKLQTDNTTITAHDMFIAESTGFIYIFGTITSPSNPGYIDFTIPSSFDASVIGLPRNGARKSLGGTTASASTFEFVSPSTITIPSGSGTYMFIGTFEKST